MPENKKLNWNSLSKYRSQIYGISMIWIVIFHLHETYPKMMNYKCLLSDFFKRGNTGVEVFLFLSGISMYYAMKKFEKGREQRMTLRNNLLFFWLRVKRILLIYVLFGISYFYLIHVRIYGNLKVFWRMVFFACKDVNSFWFLLCIAICYLLYPWIYSLMKKNPWYLVVILIVYEAGLILFANGKPDLFEYDEILLMRIPVFLLGAMAGPLVYEKKEISKKVCWTFILLSLCRYLIMYYLKLTFLWKYVSLLYGRRYMTIQAIGFLFVLLMILPYAEETRGFRLLGALGSCTLETYVLHIIIRGLVNNYTSFRPKSKEEALVFAVCYVMASFGLGYALHQGMSFLLKGTKTGKRKAEAPR